MYFYLLLKQLLKLFIATRKRGAIVCICVVCQAYFRFSIYCTYWKASSEFIVKNQRGLPKSSTIVM